jgi:hypothetical protein
VLPWKATVNNIIKTHDQVQILSTTQPAPARDVRPHNYLSKDLLRAGGWRMPF